MDRSYINTPYSRPYQATCGMQCSTSGHRMADSKEGACESPKQMDYSAKEEHRSALHHMPLAMAYIPKQHFHKTFDLTRALQEGTIFPGLCKPFCGKRGMKK